MNHFEYTNAVVGPELGRILESSARLPGALGIRLLLSLSGHSEPQEGSDHLVQRKLSQTMVMLGGFSSCWLCMTRPWVLFVLGRFSN